LEVQGVLMLTFCFATREQTRRGGKINGCGGEQPITGERLTMVAKELLGKVPRLEELSFSKLLMVDFLANLLFL
jgi:hypothetical protein